MGKPKQWLPPSPILGSTHMIDDILKRGYHATGLTPEDSRCSFAANDSWLAWDGLNFAAFADGDYFIRLVDGSGNYAEGYAGPVGGGETPGSEILDGWTNDGYDTFTVDGINITEATEVGANDTKCYDTIPATDGLLYSFIVVFVATSGTNTQVMLGAVNSFLPTNVVSLDLKINPIVSGTYYFAKQVGIYVGFRNTAGATSWLSTPSLKQITEPAATAIHILDGPSGSAAWAEIDEGFDYNDIVEIEIVPTGIL